MNGRVWLVALGIFLVIEGLPYLVAPGAMKRLLLQLREAPDAALRVMGLLAVLSGFALLFWLRRGV